MTCYSKGLRERAIKCLFDGHFSASGDRVIFLPPYPPELNPIEHFRSVLKKRLHSAMSCMKSLDETIALCL